MANEKSVQTTFGQCMVSWCLFAWKQARLQPQRLGTVGVALYSHWSSSSAHHQMGQEINSSWAITSKISLLLTHKLLTDVTFFLAVQLFSEYSPAHVSWMQVLNIKTSKGGGQSHMTDKVPCSLPRDRDPCSKHCHCMCSPMGTFHSCFPVWNVQIRWFPYLQNAAARTNEQNSFMPMSTSELEANLFQYERLFMQLLSGIPFALITATFFSLCFINERRHWSLNSQRHLGIWLLLKSLVNLSIRHSLRSQSNTGDLCAIAPDSYQAWASEESESLYLWGRGRIVHDWIPKREADDAGAISQLCIWHCEWPWINHIPPSLFLAIQRVSTSQVCKAPCFHVHG